MSTSAVWSSNLGKLLYRSVLSVLTTWCQYISQHSCLNLVKPTPNKQPTPTWVTLTASSTNRLTFIQNNFGVNSYFRGLKTGTQGANLVIGPGTTPCGFKGKEILLTPIKGSLVPPWLKYSDGKEVLPLFSKTQKGFRVKLVGHKFIPRRPGALFFHTLGLPPKGKGLASPLLVTLLGINRGHLFLGEQG